jgi:hypothetical protein
VLDPSSDVLSCTCEPGKMLIGESCSVCERGKYKSEPGVQSCELCGSLIKGATTKADGAKSATDCKCDSGSFLVGTGGETKACDASKEGMNATRFGATLEEVPLLAGFWRISINTSDIRQCPVAEACVGGADPVEYCREGHDGPYCNLCEAGFSKDVFGLCQECQTSTTSIIGTVLTVVGLLLLAVALVVVNKRLKRNERVKAASKAAACGLKILFVTYQILATLPSIIPNLTLPANFKAMLSSIQFTKLNLFQLVSVGCVAGGFDFHLCFSA